MSVSEVKQALGEWSLSLRSDTPRELLDALEPFGHVVVTPGRLPAVSVGDNLLSEARYVGVYRGLDKDEDGYGLKGAGMAFWLGDEDGKGAVYVDPVVIASATFPNTIRALLPESVAEGTLYSIPSAGTYSATHQWESPRKAITYVTDTFSTDTYPVSWRVNGDGTLDAGRDVDLYGSIPRSILVRKGGGQDLRYRGLLGSMSTEQDVEDYTTRVVLLAEGEGAATVTASASNPTTYRDLFGNELNLTRLVSESTTEATNADARAQLQLNRFTNPRYAVDLAADDYDVQGSLAVGEMTYVFDPDVGLVDPSNEVIWRGEVLNPIALRITELSWPIEEGWTVAFRRGSDGRWLDLSDYYRPETGRTTIKVGEFSRALSALGSEPVGSRPMPDSSSPATPVFNTPFSTVAYQSQAANDVRAAVYLTWEQPLNQDGSTIRDGDHYEIRYRATETFNYSITWDQAHDFTWDELQSWGRPLSNPAAVADQWTTVYVPWGTTELMLPELTVQAEYEFQIRAVDGASPPNQSPFSASVFFTTHGDVIGPDTPAAPEVHSNPVSIQVIHTLGTSAGGTYNLANDLHHLEVHVGGADFSPDESTHIGDLVANQGMMAARVPALATFTIANTETIYVRVVAVDRFGNRSSASPAVQGVADLIDDEHISSLTASKITAGTIGADLLVSGSIKTAQDGARAELNINGIQLYDSDGELTINLAPDPDPTLGQFLQIRDGDATLASIDSTGVISGESVYVADDIIIGGENLIDDIIDPRPRGIIAFSGPITTPVVGGGASVQRGFVELGFTAEADRQYMIVGLCEWESTVANDRIFMFLLDGGSETPTIANGVEIQESITQGVTNIGGNSSAMIVFIGELAAGEHRILWAFNGVSGNATIQASTNPAVGTPAYMWIEDLGIPLEENQVFNDGGVPALGSGTISEPSGTVQTYTKNYPATWSATYDGSSWVDYYGSEAHQGVYGGKDRRSLIGFDYRRIMSDLSGATVLECKVTIRFVHWWSDAGGTAVIGTHDYTGRPGSWSGSRVNEDRLRSGSWPKPGTRTVNLGTTIGNEFKSGAAKGVALGPAPSSSLTYYGRANGNGMSSEPYLTIKYRK